MKDKMPQLLLLCLLLVLNNEPQNSQSVTEGFHWHIEYILLKMWSKMYYSFNLFQLHFSYSYFISVTITFQLPALFQLHLQLTDLKYFSYWPFQLQLT